MNQVGIHLSNAMHRELYKCFQIPFGCATILHLNCTQGYSHRRDDGSMADYFQGGRHWSILEAWVRGISQDGWLPTPPHPGITHVRFYKKGWLTADPIQWAREAANAYYSPTIPGGPRICDLTKHFSLWNEPNLPDEAGGPFNPATDYARFNQWAVPCLEEFRRLCPDAIIHFGAFAFGHSDDQEDVPGIIGINICADAIRLCHMFDHHPYWFDENKLMGAEAQWYAWRFIKAARLMHQIVPDMPFFLSECGYFGHNSDDPDAARHYRYFFEELRNFPYVLAATPFIWDTDAAHPGQPIYCNRPLVAELDSLARAAPEPPPPPPPDEYAVVDRIGEMVAYWSGYPQRELADVVAITVHHTTGTEGHIADADLAKYTYGIGSRGDVSQFVPLDRAVWNTGDAVLAGDENRYNIGIGMIGTFTDSSPTEVARKSLRRLITDLIRGLPKFHSLKGHRDWRLPDVPIHTVCPGGSWWEEFRRDFWQRLLAGENANELAELREDNAALRYLVDRAIVESAGLVQYLEANIPE